MHPKFPMEFLFLLIFFKRDEFYINLIEINTFKFLTFDIQNQKVLK